MRLQTKNTKKIRLIISGCIILLLVASVLAYYLLDKNEDKSENTVNYDKASSSQKETGGQAKKDFVDRVYGTDETSSPSADQPVANTNKVGVVLTSIMQQADVVSVRTIIQTVGDGGTCVLELSKPGSEPIKQSAETQSMGSYVVCRGFDLSTNGLAKGNWNVTVKYQGENDTSGSAEGLVEIK